MYKKREKIKVHDTASELCNDFLETYYHKYFKLSHNKRKKIESKYDLKDLFLDFLMDMIIVCGQKIKKN